MTDDSRLRCPKCGGRDVKDLSTMRRGAGFGMIALGVMFLAVLAVIPVRAPTWSLVACGALSLLGVVAVLGAAAAKYCPQCDVRLVADTGDEPPSDDA